MLLFGRKVKKLKHTRKRESRQKRIERLLGLMYAVFIIIGLINITLIAFSEYNSWSEKPKVKNENSELYIDTLRSYAKDIEGRLDFVCGYIENLESDMRISKNASIQEIHRKISDYTNKSTDAVCRHFAPLLFVSLTYHNYSNGLKCQIGFYKPNYTIFVFIKEAEGKKIYSPNHVWVSINGTIYEPFWSANDWDRRWVYIEWRNMQEYPWYYRPWCVSYPMNLKYDLVQNIPILTTDFVDRSISSYEKQDES